MDSEMVVVTRKCYDCGGAMRGRRENYRYTECGLNSVTLLDVLVFHCACGAIAPEIPGVGVLHEVIAYDLLKKGSLLAADEIRFLRKMAGYTATKLATIMGVGNEAVSRWENGKGMIGKESDRLLRFVCFDAILRSLYPNAGDDSQKMLEIARRVQSFNLPEFLGTVEERINDPKMIRISPEMLAQFGYVSAQPDSLNTTPVN